jgi:hypothetical protein
MSVFVERKLFKTIYYPTFYTKICFMPDREHSRLPLHRIKRGGCIGKQWLLITQDRAKNTSSIVGAKGAAVRDKSGLTYNKQ